MKITVVGAGAVGATCADNIVRKELAHEVVLLDIKEGLSEGKAQDMMQTATLLGFDTRIEAKKRGSLHHILRLSFRKAFFNIQQYDFVREFLAHNVIGTSCTNSASTYNSDFHVNNFCCF